jgi:uncharacterized membrane protein
MKYAREFVVNAVVGGLLVLLPAYLAVLLLLKGMETAVALASPLLELLPDWARADNLISLLLLALACFLVGLAVRTPAGRRLGQRLEDSLFGKLPGYQLMRSLTRRVAGRDDASAWKPALIETDDSLVPAFIIEELDDGRYTIFVPSVPTPLAGAIYVMARERVHPLEVPLTQALVAISSWGSGAKALVAAMRRQAVTSP